MCVFQCTPLARAHAYAALHNASASDLLYLPVSFQFTSFSCACSLHLHAWKRLNGLTNSSESHTNLSLFPTGLPERDTYPSLHNLTTASCLRPSSFNKSLTPAYDHNTLFTGHSKLNVSAFLRYDGNLLRRGSSSANRISSDPASWRKYRIGDPDAHGQLAWKCTCGRIPRADALAHKRSTRSSTLRKVDASSPSAVTPMYANAVLCCDSALCSSQQNSTKINAIVLSRGFSVCKGLSDPFKPLDPSVTAGLFGWNPQVALWTKW